MEHANLAAWLLERGDDDAIALLRGDVHVLYRELRVRVRAAAARWQALGVAPGKILPLVGGNSIELVVGYLGALWAGAIPALVPALAPAGLQVVVRETEAAVLAAPAVELERLPAIADVRAVAHEEPFAGGDDAHPGLEPDGLGLLLYTSGSTAAPKGVMLSKRNVQTSTQAIASLLSLVASDRAYLPMPLHYCYGLSVLHTHLRAGASVYLGDAQHPEPILDELQSSGATGVASVPTFFLMLLRRSALAQRQLPALRYAMVSGGRLDPSHVQALRQSQPDLRLYMRYGVTELTAAASCLPPESLDDKLGSIGRGLPGLPLDVLDEHGARVAVGQEGQIVVRGDHVALGYFRDEDATARAFAGGRFHTGDLARVDGDGFIFLIGRSSEFVKSGGHRIAPREIEELLTALPDVAEACVFGITHAQRGEALAAAVVATPGHTPSLAALRQACAQALPAFKVPVEFRVLASLPRTATGKVDRRALQQEPRASGTDRPR